jgi:hypothetical protein
MMKGDHHRATSPPRWRAGDDGVTTIALAGMALA